MDSSTWCSAASSRWRSCPAVATARSRRRGRWRRRQRSLTKCASGRTSPIWTATDIATSSSPSPWTRCSSTAATGTSRSRRPSLSRRVVVGISRMTRPAATSTATAAAILPWPVPAKSTSSSIAAGRPSIARSSTAIRSPTSRRATSTMTGGSTWSLLQDVGICSRRGSIRARCWSCSEMATARFRTPCATKRASRARCRSSWGTSTTTAGRTSPRATARSSSTIRSGCSCGTA